MLLYFCCSAPSTQNRVKKERCLSLCILSLNVFCFTFYSYYTSHFPCFPSTDSIGPQVPLISEPKPTMMMNTPPLMNCHNNGSYQPPYWGVKHELIPPEVAQLMQLEEGIRPALTERRKPPVPARHLKKFKEHCTIDMNGLETNV